MRLRLSKRGVIFAVFVVTVMATLCSVNCHEASDYWRLSTGSGLQRVQDGQAKSNQGSRKWSIARTELVNSRNTRRV